MNLRHLTIFQAVCQEGSITNAAKALSMTQPAISHAITELEDSAGIPLFDRVSRKIVLNENGKNYLSKVIPLLELFHDLENTAENLDSSIPLRIGSSGTLATFLLPQAVARFGASYPNTKISVEVSSSGQVEQKLVANELDLGLIEGVVTDDRLEKIPFSSYPLAVICSPNHPCAAAPAIDIDQLAELPLLLREKGCTIRDTFDSALLLRNLSITPRWTSSNSHALLEAVKCGLGLCVLPRIFADEHIRRGEVVEVEVKDLDLSCMNHVAFHKDKFQTESFQSFINLVLFD